MVLYPELADHEREFVAHFRDLVDEVIDQPLPSDRQSPLTARSNYRAYRATSSTR